MYIHYGDATEAGYTHSTIMTMKLETYIKEKAISIVSTTEELKEGFSTPFIVITATIGGKISTWKMGTYKAKCLLTDLLTTLVPAVEANQDCSTWKMQYFLPSTARSKYPNKPMNLSANHVAVLYLASDKLKEYIDKHSTVKSRKCITKPETTQYVSGLDVIDAILVPCYAKKDTDTGEGLAPWFLTFKKARKIVNYAFDGDMETVAEEHVKLHPEEDLVWHATTMSCNPYDVTFTIEEVRAYIKYRKDIEKFVKSMK